MKSSETLELEGRHPNAAAAHSNQDSKNVLKTLSFVDLKDNFCPALRAFAPFFAESNLRSVYTFQIVLHAKTIEPKRQTSRK